MEMTAEIICPECKHANPENSIFCNNCGTDLKGNIEERIRRYETRIEAAAERAETETYERVTKWAKLSTWVISIALTIIGGTISVGAYLGFDSILEFKDTINKYNVQVDNSIQQIKKAEDEAKNELEKLNKSKGDWDKIINKQEAIEKELNESQKLIRDAYKLGNKFFDINIQVDANIPNRSKLIQSIAANLINDGFIVDAAKIFDVNVNQTEILYYSPYTEAKAKTIAMEVSEELKRKNVVARFVKSSDRNRYKILIKLGNV